MGNSVGSACGMLIVGKSPVSRSSKISSSSSTSLDVTLPASLRISSSSCGRETDADILRGTTSSGSFEDEATARTWSFFSCCVCRPNRVLIRSCQDAVDAMGVETVRNEG